MIGQRILNIVAEQGERPALINHGQCISYAEFADSALRFAAALQPFTGTNPPYPLGIQLPNASDYAIVVTALLILGVPILTVNPQWGPDEVSNALGGLPITGFLTSDPGLSRWKDSTLMATIPVLGLETLKTLGKQALPLDQSERGHVVPADHPALYLMTSGTTGMAKPVVRSQYNLLANAHNVGQALGWLPGHRVLPVTPFHHANGFSNGLLLPLLSGSCIVTLEQFFPARLLQILRETPVDTIIASPVVYRALLASDSGCEALGSLRQALSSGAPLTEDLADQVARQTGLCIRELYGSSESGTVTIEPERKLGEPRNVGIPIPGVELAILSVDGEHLPAGEAGHIAVQSQALMQGYWTPSGIEPARTEHGWYLMGDTGFIDHQGELHLQGRTRTFINVGGNKINPKEIESVINGITGVIHSRVQGYVNKRGREEIHALITIHPSSGLTRIDLINQMRCQLSEYKLPQRIELQHPNRSALPVKGSDVIQDCF
ncbi:MAG: class I adenylate-forming enzyme family protein [Cyanobium sp.]